MEEVKLQTKVLEILDRALTEPARERDGRAARQMLAEIRRKFGDTVAAGYANQGICLPGVQRQMKSLLDGPAPVRATAPAATAPRSAAPPPPPPAPKPTPTISTNVLHRVLFASVQASLPIDYCSLAEAAQRKALLVGAWKSHCESVLPESLAAEVTAATAGLRRRELTGSARTVAGFTKQTITRELKRMKITVK